MHILMAAVEALEVPAETLVLNRTSLQQQRTTCRHDQYDDEKSEFVTKVKNLIVDVYYFKYT